MSDHAASDLVPSVIDDYPRLAELGTAASGYGELRDEAWMALDEISRLREETGQLRRLSPPPDDGFWGRYTSRTDFDPAGIEQGPQ